MAAGETELRLYAILDAETCAHRGVAPVDVAQAWRDAGVRLLQYRDKNGTDEDVLHAADAIAHAFRTATSFLLLNDRVHLLHQCGWDGAHIGQGDTSAAQAREQAGDGAILGLSTHNPEQAEAAGREDLDYIAIGPVFPTATKLNPEPVVGLCGLQAVRALVRRPLVAIGGIGLDQAPQVRAAGADAIALISALIPAPDTSISSIQQRARDFLRAFK